VDIETRRKKQQELMRRMVERKVRSRAQQLYESRGQGDGRELEDWFQAESEVLDAPGLARLYRRLHSESTEGSQERSQHQDSSRESA
jgi:Protein of unknown function (DUF2934)